MGHLIGAVWRPMFSISHQISIPDEEIEFSAIRAQGSGGQNVNKGCSNY